MRTQSSTARALNALLILATLIALANQSPLTAQTAAASQQDLISREFANVLLDSGMGAEYLVGQMPPMLPGVEDLAAEARVIGSVVRRERSRSALAVSDPVTEARERFEAKLLAAGWIERPQPQRAERGFVPAYAEDPNRAFCWPETAAQLSLKVRPAPNGTTHVILDYMFPEPGRSCDPPGVRPRPESGLAALLPTLRPPDGSRILGGGSGGSLDEIESTSRALSDVSPANLIAHFEPQLRDQGWSTLERITGESVATVSARKPGDAGTVLLLWVTAYVTGDDERQLSMRLMVRSER